MKILPAWAVPLFAAAGATDVLAISKPAPGAAPATHGSAGSGGILPWIALFAVVVALLILWGRRAGGKR